MVFTVELAPTTTAKVVVDAIRRSTVVAQRIMLVPAGVVRSGLSHRIALLVDG
jgi:hypothetical protein